MRAAILLLPLAAFASLSAGGGRGDPAANDAAANDMMMVPDGMAPDETLPMNVSEAGGIYSDDGVTNSSVGMTPSPAWMAGGTWLYAGEEAAGPIWYFEALDSDFAARPMRVELRTDETPEAARTSNNTARTAEVDCEARRYRILRTVQYDDAGNATEANERGDGSMVPIIPDTVFAAVADSVSLHVAARESRGETTYNGM